MAEEEEKEALQDDYVTVVGRLEKEMDELYLFRDLFFEKNPVEKASDKVQLVADKMNELIEKFEEVDENQLSPLNRARYLYLKGRTYNITSKYDSRASQCLSKAVKLNPRLVDAWNELGECYWKNLNIIDAKNSFEGALKNERSKVALRCLSIILRQDKRNTPGDSRESIQQSVEYAKEAVSLDPKDGVSWCVLGNAYMCQYFMVAQDPVTLRACMSAYKQAEMDAVARGQPDFYYNRGVALKYDEQYSLALENFERAKQLDPSWTLAAEEIRKLITYLTHVNDLVRTRGKIKTKKLQQMVQSIDDKMLGPYSVEESFHTFGRRKDVIVSKRKLDTLSSGQNEGAVIVGKVVGSIHSENVVPFTFAIVDESLSCVCVTVYNWANGRGVIIGDCVVIPEPHITEHHVAVTDLEFKFKSIRVNNPMMLLVNGKKIGRNQFAGTRVTSTYDIAH